MLPAGQDGHRSPSVPAGTPVLTVRRPGQALLPGSGRGSGAAMLGLDEGCGWAEKAAGWGGWREAVPEAGREEAPTWTVTGSGRREKRVVVVSTLPRGRSWPAAGGIRAQAVCAEQRVGRVAPGSPLGSAPRPEPPPSPDDSAGCASHGCLPGRALQPSPVQNPQGPPMALGTRPRGLRPALAPPPCRRARHSAGRFCPITQARSLPFHLPEMFLSRYPHGSISSVT